VFEVVYRILSVARFFINSGFIVLSGVEEDSWGVTSLVERCVLISFRE
jgi:hypothetical protein